MPLTLFASDRFVEHQTPPGHPEAPERAEVMDRVAVRWQAQGGAVATPQAATNEALARVHAPEYLDRIAATAGRATALDPDTFTSPATHEIALLAAGAAVDAVSHSMGGRRRSLALVRPPGHHAERARAMGFCFYNNVAVAAAHARAAGASRVAVVDYDVHHGNGTQHIFERDPSVLYVSTHQYPYYPGTGGAGEIGKDEGEGFTVNAPLEAGAVDEDYRLVFAELVVPVLRQFAPDLVLVSAGFDAHERDPLGGMRLTTAAFAAMTAELRQVADECSGGCLALVVEGGYDLEAFGDSLSAVVDVLAGDREYTPAWPAPGDVVPTRARTAIVQARQHLGRFWTL
jgi:acetoin utilization deacetylase AcuC-like enzyme